MILIYFSENTAQVQEQLSKYDYGQNSESKFVYTYLTNISDIKITYNYNYNYIIIQYTNYHQCMMFPILTTHSVSALVVISLSQAIRPLSCMICDFPSLDKYKMNLHTAIHHDDKPYHCLNRAKTSQSSNTVYICKIHLLCRIYDKNFSIKKPVHTSAYPIPNAVSETHTGKKPHYHVLCKLTITHSGIKFHLWTIYITAKHINLMCHMTTHTGEKPRKCPQCALIPLCLIRSSHMPKTMHTQGISLACMKSVMLNCIIINPTNHIRFYSKERPYPCSYCDRTLPNSTNILMPSFF